jgi:alpha-glucosidase (family GH31 glycosyl hydrolase)
VLDRLGTSRLLWNNQVGHGPGVDFAVPLLVAISPGGAYGLFFDTTAQARLDTARGSGGQTLRYEADVPSFDLYFLAGPTAARVMEQYASLTGFPTMPPRWALGYLQSTRFFEDADDLLTIARTMREKQLPCDALIFLSTYGVSQGWNAGVGHLGFHPKLWSEPEALLGELQEVHGYRVVTHEYPVMHPDAPGFAEAEQRGFLLGVAYPAPPPSNVDDPKAIPRAQAYAENQRFVDFTNPDARQWWWEQHRHLVELGVAGWWLDGGEGPPGQTQMHGGDAVLLHNSFDLMRFRAFAEGETRDRPDRRPWMLCRSGAAGMQRFGAASWTGDINTTFTTFAAQIPMGLNTAMSGVPYWGTDIGGFYPAALDGELYARWFQFGTCCPLFRSHGWDVRRHLPWAHGPEVEAICRRYIELRMRLLPYLYSLAWQAHTTGQPLMRPLVYHYPADPNVWELGSQFMLGADLLVAPVTRPGATHWPVYLPAGVWYDFWTGERFQGGQSVTVATPLDTIPLFVRGGAIVSLGPVMQRTDERPLDDLELLIFPGDEPSGDDVAFDLYEDDGHSQQYRAGAHGLTNLRATFTDARATIGVQPTQGTYAGQLDARTLRLNVWLAAAPVRVRVSRNGTDVNVRPGPSGADATSADVTWSFEHPSTCRVRIPDVRRADSVSVELTLGRGAS